MVEKMFSKQRNQLTEQNIYLEFAVKTICDCCFFGIELIIAMQNADFDDNFDNILNQAFGIFFIAGLKFV